MCPHARRHPAQNWPHGPIVDRCRDCGECPCSFHTVTDIDFDDDGSDLRVVKVVPAPPDETDW